MQKRYAEAEPLLLRASHRLHSGPGQEGRNAEHTRRRLAALYDATGQAARAAAYRTASKSP